MKFFEENLHRQRLNARWCGYAFVAILMLLRRVAPLVQVGALLGGILFVCSMKAAMALPPTAAMSALADGSAIGRALVVPVEMCAVYTDDDGDWTESCDNPDTECAPNTRGERRPDGGLQRTMCVWSAEKQRELQREAERENSRRIERENAAHSVELRQRAVEVMRRAREEEPAAAQPVQSHIRQSMPSLPPASGQSKVASVPPPPDRNDKAASVETPSFGTSHVKPSLPAGLPREANAASAAPPDDLNSKVASVQKPLSGGSSHIKTSLPSPPAEKKVATKDVTCIDVNSNTCVQPQPDTPNGPTNVVIGAPIQTTPTPPYNKPGAPAWINPPVPKGGVVYDCLELTSYGCTKWTAVARNVPSNESQTSGGIRSPSRTSSASAGSSQPYVESYPYSQIEPFIVGPVFVADCPLRGYQSIPNEIATETVRGNSAREESNKPKEYTNAKRCELARFAAGRYSDVADLLACLAGQYKSHVPAEISPAMYSVVVSQQREAKALSEEISNDVDEADRAGKCRSATPLPPFNGGGGPPPPKCQLTDDEVNATLQYITDRANQLDKFTIPALGDPLRAKGCDAPDIKFCREAAEKHQFPLGCRSWPSKQAKQECDQQQFPTQGQYEQCLWKYKAKDGPE